ncbi:MAG TPA: PIG-L family deacetylase, partial [Terrimicrobiaceae bacterium]
NPYQTFVEGFARLLSEGEALGSPAVSPVPRSPNDASATALIFSPHPDDEVIIGGLPLRLLRESAMNVVNVAVTLGSRRDRRAERWQELRNCCEYIGFDLIAASEDGLEEINLDARLKDPGRWSASVEVIANLLAATQPAIIFFPHDDDWNKAHIGVHHLIVEALSLSNLACDTIETEFWRAMGTPNLMVESSEADVADLVAALSLHTGEVVRNAYHLRLPSWMIDNVRRGAELVGGQGGTSPRFTFATLYRLRRWQNGRFCEVLKSGRMLSRYDDLRQVFPTTTAD